MGVKVAKFGGSSLADAGQFAKVKSIVCADETRRYIVPSAPGKRTYKDEKITDMLYETQRRARTGEPIGEVFDRIVERYVDIAFELELKVDILAHLQKVRRDIEAGADADYAASRGEYLSGLLLADYLGYEFVDAADIVRFDAEGRFDADVTQALASARLKRCQNAVVPGFYGARPDGSIKTFSRGGSDISGAIVARGVFADVYENWTDVSGMLMADPRVVSGPQPIKAVTYTELRELAYMGATVLHDEAIFPVRQACIPINVKNTNDTEADGTYIVPDSTELPEHQVTGVAGRKGFTVITLEKDNMNTEVGFAAKALTVLARHGVSIEHMPTGIDTLSIVVEESRLGARRQQVLDEMFEACRPDSMEVSTNLALIAVVGRGMIARVGTSAKVFAALAAAGVNVRMIDQGSSEINIIVGVDEAAYAAAVNALYNAFVE